MPETPVKSFRLKPKTLKRLEWLAELADLTQTAYLEQLIKKEAASSPLPYRDHYVKMKPEIDQMKQSVENASDAIAFGENPDYIVRVHIASLEWLLAEYKKLLADYKALK